MKDDDTNVRMSAVVGEGSDIANNISGACWPCGYCERFFGTKIGLGQHKRHAHPDELNNERQEYQRPSRGTGQREVVSSRRHWTESEIKSLVKFQLELRKANPSKSEIIVNEKLAKLLPGRSVEAIWCFKKSDKYRSTFSQMAETLRKADRTQTRERLTKTVAGAQVSSTITSPQIPTAVVEVSLVAPVDISNNPRTDSPSTESPRRTREHEEGNGNTLLGDANLVATSRNTRNNS